MALVGASAAPGQPRRADDRGGGPQPVPPAHLPGQPAVRGHRRRAVPALASPRCPSRWTWRCSRCPTPRLRRSWRPRGRQARSAVIFGSAYDPPGPPGLRERLAAIAGQPGMAVCGAGCMGFVNVARGLRALGYVEPDPLPPGRSRWSPIPARCSRRCCGRAAASASPSPSPPARSSSPRPRPTRGTRSTCPETRVLALVLEAIRDAAGLREVLADAPAADIPVVLLNVGRRRPARRWWPRTPARWPRTTARGRHWPPPTACTGSATWRSWPTRWSSSAGARAPPAPPTDRDRARLRPGAAHVADLAAEARRAVRPIPRRPRAAGRACSTRAWSRGTRWTCGGPAATRSRCSPAALTALTGDPPSAPWRSPWTWCPSSTATTPTRRRARRGRAHRKPVAVLARSPAAIDPAAAAGCARPGSRCSRAPGPACSRCATCSTPRISGRARRRRRPPRAVPADGPPRAGARLTAAELFDLLRDYGIPAVRARGRPRTLAGRSRRPTRSATRSRSRPTSRASRTSPTSAASGWAARRPSAAAYADLAARLGPRVAGLRDGRAGPRARPWAWSATRHWARSS